MWSAYSQETDSVAAAMRQRASTTVDAAITNTKIAAFRHAPIRWQAGIIASAGIFSRKCTSPTSLTHASNVLTDNNDSNTPMPSGNNHNNHDNHNHHPRRSKQQRCIPNQPSEEGISMNDKSRHSWQKSLRHAAVSAALAVYGAYPISSLWFFRLPEQFSWLGLFQNDHQCTGTATRHGGACLAVAAGQLGILVPFLGLAWIWGSQRVQRKGQVTAMCFLLGLGFAKLCVDHYLLFHPPEDSASLQGKVAVITGANRGIGYATAWALAQRGAHVVVTCRSLAKCQPIVEEIATRTQHGSASAKVFELRSLASAAHLAQELSAEYSEIHYFFANAGTTPRHALTEEGFEDGFGGMHLAHMAVILGILPNLERSGNLQDPSRIVIVTSEMALNAALGVFGNDLIFSNSDAATNTSLEMDMKDDWRGERIRGDGTLGPSLAAYARAKLCGVLFAFALNRRLVGKPVVAHAVHTGAVATDSSRDAIVRAFPSWIPGLRWLVAEVYFRLLWRDVGGGARAILCPALSNNPYILKGGQYLDALCHPFLHDVDPNVNRRREVELPARPFGGKPRIIQYSPVLALLLADIRWSERLWDISIAFLKSSPARETVMAFAPGL